jgi:hypothetical protein
MELSFVSKLGIRRVWINGNIITFEQGGIVGNMDLDKIKIEDADKYKIEKKLMMELKNLKTEKQKADNIIKDFQKTGWRLVRSG